MELDVVLRPEEYDLQQQFLGNNATVTEVGSLGVPFLTARALLMFAHVRACRWSV